MAFAGTPLGKALTGATMADATAKAAPRTVNGEVKRAASLDAEAKALDKAAAVGLTATQIVASHDLDFVARLCTRAVVLDRGALVAEGAIATILADRELLRAHGLD